MGNTIIWLTWESQNKWPNSLLGSLESLSCADGAFLTLVWQAGPCSFDFISTNEAPDSPFFSSFSHTNPSYSSFSRWWMCRLWWCQHLQPWSQVTFRPTSLVPSGTEGRQGVLLLCSQHIWTSMGGRKLNFIAVKMAIPLAFGYVGAQTDALKSWREFSYSQTRNSLWGTDLQLRLVDHTAWGKGLLGPFGQEAGKNSPSCCMTEVHEAQNWCPCKTLPNKQPATEKGSLGISAAYCGPRQTFFQSPCHFQICSQYFKKHHNYNRKEKLAFSFDFFLLYGWKEGVSKT